MVKSFDVLIIALHSIEKEEKVKFEINIQTFEWLLKLLSENKYKSITLGQFYDFTKGIGTLPDKPVIITSDDGFGSMYKYAYPLVEKYGFSMTLFITLEYIMGFEGDRVHMSMNRMPNRPMLLWNEVKELASKGFDIQGHGINHCNFTDLKVEDAIWSLKKTKEVIENEIGKECAFHAWCNSNADPRLYNKMSEMGYKGFLRYSGGIENTNTIDWKMIKRVYLQANMTRAIMEERLFIKGKGDK